MKSVEGKAFCLTQISQSQSWFRARSTFRPSSTSPANGPVAASFICSMEMKTPGRSMGSSLLHCLMFSMGALFCHHLDYCAWHVCFRFCNFDFALTCFKEIIPQNHETENPGNFSGESLPRATQRSRGVLPWNLQGALEGRLCGRLTVDGRTGGSL